MNRVICFIKHFMFYVLYILLLGFNHSLQAQCACNSIGFEDNSLGCWNLKHGSFHGGNATVWTNYVSSESNQHKITDVGNYDPIADCVSKNFLSQVAPGSTHSLRLGDSDNGYRTASASIEFLVTEATTLFQLQYAVVFSDPGHTPEDQPRFKVRVNTECGDYFVISDETIEGFRSCSNDWRIKPWETVGINLSDYIGQKVELEFISTDCGRGGHGGYAYIDAGCLELDINIVNYCPGDAELTLEAPAGFTQYAWRNQSTGASFTGRSITINDPVGGETYQVEIQSVTGCIAYLDYTLPPLSSGGEITIDYIGENAFCAGGSGVIQVQGANIGTITVNGRKQSGTSIELEPLVTTRYNVVASSIDVCGKGANLDFEIEVFPFPSINLTSSSNVVCPDEVVTLSYTPQPGVSYEWVDLGINNMETVEVPISTTTEFLLRATSNSGCIVTKSTTVYVIEQGTVSYEINRLTTCPPGSKTAIFINIDNIEKVTAEYLTYLREGSGPIDSLTNLEITNGLYTIYPQTDMAIPVTFTTKGGCATLSDTIFIDVLDEAPSIDLPSNQLTICPNEKNIIEIPGDYDSLVVSPAPIMIAGNTIEIAPTQTTLYELEAFRGACEIAASNLLVSIGVPPEYTLSDTIETCLGDQVETTVQIGSENAIKWLHNDSGNSTQTFDGDSTRYYVFEVFGASDCRVTDSIWIEVLQNESIDYSLPTLSICEGTNAVLSVRSGENLKLNWSTLNTAEKSVSISPTVTTIYPVEIESESGCTVVSDSVEVVVLTSTITLPDIPDTTLCPQDSIFIELEEMNLTGYYWEELDTVTDQLMLPIDTITTYTVWGIAMDSFSCPSSPLVFKVARSETPNVTFTLNNPMPCVNDEVTLSVNIPESVMSAAWEDTQASDLSRTVAYNPLDQYALNLVDRTGCESTINIDLATFSNSSAPSYSATDVKICQGDQVTIDLDASNYQEIIWEDASDFKETSFSLIGNKDSTLVFTLVGISECVIITDSISIEVDSLKAFLPESVSTCVKENILLPFPTIDTDSITWTDIGTTVTSEVDYSVTETTSQPALIYGTNGCVVRDTLQILVSDELSYTLSTKMTTICRGDTIDLSASVIAGTEVTWKLKEQIIGDSTFVRIQPIDSAKVYVELIGSGDCISVDSIQVDVISPVAIQYNKQSYEVCHGEIVFIDLTPSNYGVIRWEDLPEINTTNFEYTAVSDIDLFFEMTDITGCSRTRDSIAISVQQIEYAFPDSIKECEGEILILPFSSNELDSIRWTFLDTIATSEIPIQLSSSEIFDAVLYGKNGCQEAVSTRLLIEQVAIDVLPTSTNLCLGDSMILTNNSSFNQTQWMNLSSRLVQDTATIAIEPSETTSYQITVISPNQCQAIDTVNITVIGPQPMVISDRIKEVCENESINLSVDCDPKHIVSWSENNIGCGISITPQVSGPIYFSYQDTFNCFEFQDSFYIEVTSIPSVDFGRASDCVYPAEMIYPEMDCNGCELKWQDGSINDFYEIPSSNIPERVVVSTFNQCGETADTLVINSIACELYAPNAFSPNGDGINDVWQLGIGCNREAITNFELSVFNRWGDLIFYSQDIQEAWDGEQEAIGVYTWLYRYYDAICQKTIVKSGDVTIIL